ncbi:LamG-like jellyroll fold domain-containing protein [Catenuloplanes japonicus]|uniref:LamG-like jellyroll fold domain-containing protein n=1 Tax=Catenuloplanes japonicus TaxID=33876 RepID=UPI0022B67AD6|nr:LamG-like jellyroll fold domain-containing protein [Catenuloplanes japonicus]
MSGPGIDTPAGYTGTHRIGSGGGATVYRAWDERGMRWVALKLFHRYVRDQASATAFHESCRALGRLGAHPSIVAVHAVGVTPTGRAWQAMRLGEGGTLGEALLRTGPVDQAWALAAGARLADALAYAHGLAVPHGAVRLSNVLLDLESRPLLSDFGVGSISGTDWATPSGDVAGLGGVLFALLTGAMPQAGFGVRAGLATPGVQAVPGLAGVLGAVLGVPSERPVRSARDFGDRLREVQAAAGFAVSATDTGVTVVVPEARRAEPEPVVSASPRAATAAGDAAGSDTTAGGAVGGGTTAGGGTPDGAASGSVTTDGAMNGTAHGDAASGPVIDGGADAGPERSDPGAPSAESVDAGEPSSGGLMSKPSRGLGFGLGRQRRRVLGTGFGRRSGGNPEIDSPVADSPATGDPVAGESAGGSPVTGSAETSSGPRASGDHDIDPQAALDPRSALDPQAASEDAPAGSIAATAETTDSDPAAPGTEISPVGTRITDSDPAASGTGISPAGTRITDSDSGADGPGIPEVPDAADSGAEVPAAPTGEPAATDKPADDSVPGPENRRIADLAGSPADDGSTGPARAATGSAPAAPETGAARSTAGADVDPARAGRITDVDGSADSAGDGSAGAASTGIPDATGVASPSPAQEPGEDDAGMSATPAGPAADRNASESAGSGSTPDESAVSADPGMSPPDDTGRRTIAATTRRPWRTSSSGGSSSSSSSSSRGTGLTASSDAPAADGSGRNPGGAAPMTGSSRNSAPKPPRRKDTADLTPIELMLRRDTRRRRITVATLTAGTLLIGAAALPATRSLIVDGLDRDPAPSPAAPQADGSAPPPVRAPRPLPPDGVGGGLALWWAADEGTGTTAGDGTSNANEATLSDGAGWEPAGRGGKGSALRFSASAQDSFVAGARAAVRTDRSFTVMAWAYLTDRRDSRAIVSQPGVLSSAFIIRYDRAGDSWQALLPRADATGPDLDVATSTSTPQLRTWTHLALAFDATSGKVTLYVNGRAEDTIRHPNRWHATGAIQAGRARVDGAWTDPFGGAVDDVRAYNRPLTAAEIAAVAG